MENFDYLFWGFIIGVAGLVLPIVVPIARKKFFDPKNIKIRFSNTFRNESNGEPFVEIIPDSGTDNFLVLPYLAMDIHIKNNGGEIFYLDDVDVEFQCLGAKIVGQSFIHKDSSPIEIGRTLTVTFKVDIREKDLLPTLTECKLRFKVTEVSGKTFYTRFFKPSISFERNKIV